MVGSEQFSPKSTGVYGSKVSSSRAAKLSTIRLLFPVVQVTAEGRAPGRPEASGAEGQHHIGPAGNGGQRGMSASGRRTDYVPVGSETVVQMSNNVFTIVQHGILSIVLSVVLLVLGRPKCPGRIPPGCILRSREFAAASRGRLPGAPFRIRW